MKGMAEWNHDMQETAWLENSHQLRNRCHRIWDMFEYGIAFNRPDGVIENWQRLNVPDDVDPWKVLQVNIHESRWN